jgi:hypothetical protein
MRRTRQEDVLTNGVLAQTPAEREQDKAKRCSDKYSVHASIDRA